MISSIKPKYLPHLSQQSKSYPLFKTLLPLLHEPEAPLPEIPKDNY